MDEKILVTRPSMPSYEEYIGDKTVVGFSLDYKYGNVSPAA